MEKLTKEQVERIAYLSRLRLTEAEAELFSGQMTEILDYVSLLSEVDTSGIEPFVSVTGLKNHLREDEVIDKGLKIEDIEQNAPVMEGRHIKIKAVLEGK